MADAEVSWTIRKNVKDALSLPNSCSQETVDIVRSLLEGNVTLKHSGQGPKQKKPLVKERKPETAKAKQSSKKSLQTEAEAQKTDIFEDPEVVLRPKDRIAFATELINIVLQTLSTTTNVPDSRVSTNGEHVNKESPAVMATTTNANKSNTVNTTISTAGCQGRSPKHTSTTRGVPKTNSKSQIGALNGSTAHRSVTAIAECGKLAFECLRKEPPLTAKTTWQLEGGILAFIGRLLALGLTDLATKELRANKQYLEMIMNVSTPNRGVIPKIKQPSAERQETLASLMHFGNVDVHNPALVHIISHQTLVLKLTSATKRPAVIEALVQFLEVSSPASPINLLLSLSTLPTMVERAANQLERVAQLILTLCQHSGNDSCADLKDHKTSLNVETCFRLQTLAFECHVAWRRLAKHRGNVDLEILKPFQRCMTSYIKTSKATSTDIYHTISCAYKSLIGKVNEYRHASSELLPVAGPVHVEILLQLGRVAQTASLWTEAKLHALDLIAIKDTKECSEARKTLAVLRLAVVSLHQCDLLDNSNDVQNCLLVAIEALNADLALTLSDLVLLLQESMGLRNAIMIITAKVLSKLDKHELERYDSFVLSCQMVLITHLRILRKCLRLCETSSTLHEVADTRTIELRHQVAQAVRPSIESIISWYKSQKFETLTNWETQDAAIQDCLVLLQLMQTVGGGQEHDIVGVGDSPTSLYAKLSHIYWNCYHACKTNNGTLSMMYSRLKRSCDCMIGRPVSELKAASLPLKLAKLGQLCESRKEFSRAREALNRSIQVSIQCGALPDIGNEIESAFNYPTLPESTEVNLVSQTVERLLHLSGREDFEPPGRQTFFDDIQLNPNERTRVLELQLGVISKSLTSTTIKMLAKKTIPSICELLLALYENDQHPDRRWRLAMIVIQLAIDDNDVANHHIITQFEARISDECNQPIERTSRQWARLEHLRASLLVMIALRDPSDCINKITHAVDIWTALIHNIESRDIDDVDKWLARLQNILDYLDVHDRPNLKLSVLHLLLHGYEMFQFDEKKQGVTHIALALTFLRLGYSEEAGIHLLKARHLFQGVTPNSEYAIACHIAYAEYYFSLGNIEKCREFSAQATTANGFDINTSGISSPKMVQSRVNEIVHWSDHLYTKTQVSWLNKPNAEALSLGKRNVEMVQRAWKSVEIDHGAQTCLRRPSALDVGCDLAGMSTAMSEMTIEEMKPKKTSNLTQMLPKLSVFWRLAPLLFRSLLLTSSMYTHFGMYQQSMHQIGQAQQLAEALGAEALLASILTRRGEYNCRSGSLVEGLQDLQKAGEAFGTSEYTVDFAQYYCSLGYSHHLTGQWQMEIKNYDHAESILDTMSSPLFLTAMPLRTSRLSITPKVANNSKPSPTRAITKAFPQKLQAKAKTRGRNAIHADQEHGGVPPTLQTCHNTKFGSVRTEISRRKAESVLAQGDLEGSLAIARNLRCTSACFEVRAQYCATLSRILIKSGMTQLSLDAVFALLPESTITFPAISISQRRRSSTHAIAAVSPIKKQQKSGSARRPPRESLGKLAAVADLLTQAIDSSSGIRSTMIRNYSISTISQICASFTNAAILLSFVQPDAIGKSICPVMVAYAIDLPKSIVSVRERLAAKVDLTKHRNLMVEDVEEAASEDQYPPLSSFQADAIDIMPDSWTGISISLDEAQEHIYLVKYQAHQSPFILRLPLTRQNADNPDEEHFTFSDAVKELEDIIQSSDATVHAAQENPDKMKAKGAKTSWWQERETLDERLKNVLLNMENVWLGAFRGIFSQSPHYPHLLGRFHQSFELILEKYLPSRQNARGRNEKAKIPLSPRIFELFVGVAYPINESIDLEEPLTDLLYYVVDILQFNGECNAYDEIDFDAMIVETQDALHSYHEAAQMEEHISETPHTILILDKQLHAFPWESMPCLEGQSVSRVSSLYDLRERINFMKHRKQEQELHQESSPSALLPTATQGISVSLTSGSYILNPSGDLSKTQTRFEPALSTLSNPTATTAWTQITARAPTEDEFTTALTPASPSENNILLYFGHGSGAQYIRPRRIKRLAHLPQASRPRDSVISSTSTSTTCHATSTTSHPSSVTSPPPPPAKTPTTPPPCNTTLLFGCSSASLATPGEYNNYGPPVTYLVAGAPAVLGSLWDVTDGDCDVFAAAVLEGWGVVPRGSCSGDGAAKVGRGGWKGKGKGKGNGRGGTKSGVKGKGRGVEGEMEAETEDEGERFGRLCLSEAAARARGECYLKYLNGAAMVVYGVPVFVSRA